MPTYQFECGGCGTRFEVRRGITEKPSVAPCPQCRARKTKQVLTGGRAIPRGRSGKKGGSGCGGCSKSSCSGCGHH